MTTTQYLAALKRLGLPPHGVKTREALGYELGTVAAMKAYLEA